MNTRPKTLHVIDHLQIGGAQRLLEVLRNGTPLSDKLYVLSFGRTTDALHNRLSERNVEIHVEPDCRLWKPSSYLRIAAAIRRINPDVVHLHLTYATILGSIAGRMARYPVVASIHNTHTVQETGLRGLTLRALESFAVRSFVKRIIFVGSVTADANCNRFTGKPMTTIDNVVEPADPETRKLREQIRSGLGAANDATVLLSTARLHPTKNIANLLTAFSLTLASCPAAQLWICGDGPLRNELQQLAKKLGVETSVKFLGSRNDIPALLHAADIFVLSSDAEGLPLALLEAMSAGLPIVATSVGSVPAYVPPEAGVVVPPRNSPDFATALTGLIQDPVRRRSLSEASLALSLRFTNIPQWRDALNAEYIAAIKQ